MEKMMSAAAAELRARCDDEATSKPELHPPHQGNNAKQNKDGRRQITEDDKLDTARWLRTAFTPGKSSADNGLAVFVLCPEEEERKAFGDFLLFFFKNHESLPRGVQSESELEPTGVPLRGG